MSQSQRPAFSRALRGHLLGQGAIMLGAGGTAWMHSMWPLALGSSAAVMMTASLVLNMTRTRKSASPSPRA